MIKKNIDFCLAIDQMSYITKNDLIVIKMLPFIFLFLLIFVWLIFKKARKRPLEEDLQAPTHPKR